MEREYDINRERVNQRHHGGLPLPLSSVPLWPRRRAWRGRGMMALAPSQLLPPKALAWGQFLLTSRPPRIRRTTLGPLWRKNR